MHKLRHAQALVVVGRRMVRRRSRPRRGPQHGGIFAHLLPDREFIGALRTLAFWHSPALAIRRSFLQRCARSASRSRPRAARRSPTLYQRAAQALLAQAERERLILVTTEKDLARTQGDAAAAELAAAARALPVTLALDDEAGFRSLLLKHLVAARKR